LKPGNYVILFGANALELLQWRASMTDEQYVDLNAATDEEWYDGV